MHTTTRLYGLSDATSRAGSGNAQEPETLAVSATSNSRRFRGPKLDQWSAQVRVATA
jgi:hypothetical protein